MWRRGRQRLRRALGRLGFAGDLRGSRAWPRPGVPASEHRGELQEWCIPNLSDELQTVNFEMRVGKSRLEALRDLAKRTGIDDIKALVAMLAQTERFGTSVAQSLRVHSDEMRVRRRQRAEEMSAKTTVKMVPPLVLFIFPALMVVIIGPAVLILLRQFINVVR